MGLFDVKSLSRGVNVEGEIPQGNEILKKTLRIAWPAVAESVLVFLVGMIDMMMVGSLGKEAIAAVGLTTQPKFIALCLFMSLNVAISAIVAHRRGQNDKESAQRVLVQALVIVVCLAAIISVLCIVFAGPILKLAGTQADTHQLAASYFKIIMMGMIFQVIMLVINAAQRGAGNTKISMRTNIVANLTNVVLNYLLIGGNLGFPRLGIQGAAIATVVGIIIGCGMSIFSVMSKKSFLTLRGVKRIIFDAETMKSILSLGSSTLTEQIFMRIGFLLYSRIIADLGTDSFAAHQIAINVLSLSFAFGDGLSGASIALVGQSLGSKRRDLARIYTRATLRIGVLLTILIATFYFTAGHFMYSLYTDDAAVLSLCMKLLPISVATVFFQVPQVIYGGCLRGAGDAKYMAFISMINLAIVRPIISWILCYPVGLGVIGAWIGLFVDQIMRMAFATMRMRGDKWMSHRV
ncbi:MAG: MATE family efflux transporter [Clostridia bacterium]|nr:MATE family efflux transporter [Clostridia bacterium]